MDRWDTKKVLGELVNVPAGEDVKSVGDVIQEVGKTDTMRMSATTESSARAFVDKYGPLRPAYRQIPPALDVVIWANVFRTAWNVPKTKEKIETLNQLLTSIFDEREPYTTKIEPGKPLPDAFYGKPRPAHFLAIDFNSGTIKPIPRHLLDGLAVELVRSHKMLNHCHNPECGRLFVKVYSRDRYCSSRCGDLMRGEGQRRWQEQHKEELNRKRRKSSKRTARSNRGKN